VLHRNASSVLIFVEHIFSVNLPTCFDCIHSESLGRWGWKTLRRPRLEPSTSSTLLVGCFEKLGPCWSSTAQVRHSLKITKKHLFKYISVVVFLVNFWQGLNVNILFKTRFLVCNGLKLFRRYSLTCLNIFSVYTIMVLLL
jgi:hypothetical protein